jgi:hypothetical protein
MTDTPPVDTPPADQTVYTPPATQDDLNRIIGERLAREREKYADYADLKARAAEYDKTLEAAKTETQKAIDAARSEGEKAATERAHQRLLRSEARAAAAAAKFRDPADAVQFLDLSAFTVSDDGTVDEKSLTAALADLATRKPYLVDDGKGTRPKPDRSQGGSGGGKVDAPSVDRGRAMFAASRAKPGASKTV